MFSFLSNLLASRKAQKLAEARRIALEAYDKAQAHYDHVRADYDRAIILHRRRPNLIAAKAQVLKAAIAVSNLRSPAPKRSGAGTRFGKVSFQ